jgi:uncharacterized protein (DUF2252 family)
VGDAHLENFGAFGADARAGEGTDGKRRVEFNLNDFDEALQGPWFWDVLRLSTSLMLAGRELGVNGVDAIELSELLIERYVASAFQGASVPAVPAPIAALVERVRERSRKALLDARTVEAAGQRRFARGDRYRDLPVDVAKLVPAAFRSYAEQLGKRGAKADELLIVDSAMRLAGTGSLGVLRIAVLTRGKGGIDGGWVFDLKEELTPSAGPGMEPVELRNAERVAKACVACLAHPPRMLGTTTLGDLSLLARRLTPQEDKLNLRQLESEDLKPVAGYLGALLGAAHARGTVQAATEWTTEQQRELLERAVALAGIHEAAYLELCRISRGIVR